MGTLREVKNALRLDKTLRPMLVKSMLHEVLIDLDGDKVADIALIDNNHDGDIDTIAVDATGNGDFNLYVGDMDGNGIIDTVQFYDDDDDMPIASYFGRSVEERFVELGAAIYTRIIAGEIIAEEILKAFEEFEKQAEEEYSKVKDEKTSENK